MEETKIIYHIDDEDTPYLVKLPIPADQVTLGDFKNVLNRPNYKFFFKSMDDDFGWVPICERSVTGRRLEFSLFLRWLLLGGDFLRGMVIFNTCG